MGKCSECGEWNSLVEEFEEGGSSHFSRITPEIKLSAKSSSGSSSAAKSKLKLTTIDGDAQEFPRVKTGISELDRVLGGGLVQGSVVLIGGDPGIGKSTLLLQTANSLAQKNNKIKRQNIKKTKSGM